MSILKNNYPYCGVCGKKVNIDNERFVEHKNKRGRICYGSFTPAHDINPFRKRRAVRAQPFGLDPAPLEEPDWDAIAQEQADAEEEQFMHELQMPVDQIIPPEAPVQDNYIQEEVLDDTEFLNQLRNL